MKMNKNNIPNTDITSIVARSMLGKISADEQARLERWLDASPENARRYKRLCEAHDFTRRYKFYTSVDSDRAWRRFSRRNLRPLRKRIILRTVSCVAAVAVLIGLVFMFRAYLFDGGQTIDKDVQAAMRRSSETGKQKAVLTFPDGEQALLLTQTYMSRESLVKKIIKNITNDGRNDRNKLTTYPDTEYWITLEDGTLVHLNGGTQFIYPESFESDSRTVRLQGEAYFQVKHDDRKPFRILTPHGEITDYGTSFNVNTRTNNGTEVVLVEGKVGVKAGRSAEVMLSPGELAYMDKRSPKVEVEKVEVSPFVSWNKGNFTFDNCPLEKLMDVIAHWYGIKVRYKSEAIRRICFTGDIDRYESAQPVLKAIEASTAELKIERNGDEFVLGKR